MYRIATTLLVVICLGGCKPPVPAEPPIPAPNSETEASESATPAPPPAPEALNVVLPQKMAAPAPVVSALVGGNAKALLVHYMPWYETPSVRGRWGAHWTGHNREHDPDIVKEDGLPDIWSHFHPLIGLYDSADPDALECQLLQMKLAGVNGVIVDWYGVNPANDFPDIHRASETLFEAAGRHGMSFAVCYEDRTLKILLDQGKITPEETPGLLRADLEWAAKNWFPAPQYFRLDGRPLLLNFGPLQVTDRGIWDSALDLPGGQPAFFALHHLWQDAGADGGFSWIHIEPFKGEPSSEVIRRRLAETHNYRSMDPKKSIPSAYPGYRDAYETSFHEPLGRREGRTMRETLQAAMEGPWPVVQLVTWNDYGEGTVIEPTHEDGYDALEAVQEARRKELGEKFAFTAADLRLPAQLYKLRKQGVVPAAELDRISRLLGEGKCAEAGRALESLSSAGPAGQ